MEGLRSQSSFVRCPYSSPVRKMNWWKFHPKMEGRGRSWRAGSDLPAQTLRIHPSSRMDTGRVFLHERKPPAAALDCHPTALPGHLLEQFESTELSRHLLQLNVVIVISVPKALTTRLRSRAKILPFTYKPNIIKCFTKRTERSCRVIVERLQWWQNW